MTAMQLTFLGTGSAVPSTTRNHTAIALRYDQSLWLFDCGEATQHQLQKSTLRMSTISKIFITHLHGDHAFGLGGLMCSLNGFNSAKEDEPPLELYGPPGLRGYVRNLLQSTYSLLSNNYVVHELHSAPAPAQIENNRHANELEGQDLLPDERGIWKLCEDDRCEVFAAPIVHTIPTVGFVLHERPLAGKMLKEELVKLKPLLEKNKEGLALQGYRRPEMILAKLKEGNVVTLPDGEVLDPAKFVGPPRKGRVVAILGDTSDPSQLKPLCENCDVIVHEATNARLKSDADKTEEEVEATTIEHGHSTPRMAGKFSKEIKAKLLVLTHFSQRYKGDESPESLAVMEEIAAQAAEEFGSTNVLTARDLFQVDISLPS